MGYLKKKRAPVSSGDASIDRIVDTIYKDINKKVKRVILELQNLNQQ